MAVDSVQIAPLGEFVDLHTEQINPGAHPDDAFEHYSIPAYDAGARAIIELGSDIKSNKFIIPAGSILLSKLNPRINRVWTPRVSGVRPAVTSTEFLVLTPKPGVDRRFLHYLLQSPIFRAELTSRVTGTSGSHQRVRPLDALDIPVTVPSLARQQSISSVLGRLDDKIEMNRQISETLDSIADATYGAWFQAYGTVENLPTGWRKAPLGQFFDIAVGGVWGEGSKTTKASRSVYCLRGIDCHDLSEVRLPDVPVRWISESQLTSRQLTTGTVLIEGSGSFCGRSLAWTDSYERLFELPVTYSNFVKRLSPKVASSQAIVAAYGLRQAYKRGLVQAFRTGTAFPNLDVKGLLTGLEVVVPTEEVAQRFVKIYSPERRVMTLLENESLRQLRDTLLPKLISGELHLPEAEQLVSEVA